MDFIANIFWSESFWFPEGSSWKDMENVPKSNIYLPQAKDMLWSVPLGLVLLAFRYVFEQLFMTPFGMWMGVKPKKQSALVPNPILEAEFEKNGMALNKHNLQAVAKQTDLTIREVERWLRERKVLSLPSDIKKFRECSWHFLFYISSFTYGLIVLWDVIYGISIFRSGGTVLPQKPWLWETNFCWKNWPRLDVSDDIYLYYLVELAFYWSLVFSMVTDHKRKDFNQMVIHHVATILLIYFSWAVNFVRIGSLVLLAHDAADFPMAAGKMFKYCGYKRVCEVLLYVFIVVWILSRLAYFPFIVLYSASFEVSYNLDPFPAYYFFNGLLILLQILHLIWTYMIARIAVVSFTNREVKDVRSDSESD